MQLVITPVGDVRCLYDESLDLTSLGSVHIQRGSHVEPDRLGQWFADMSPVGGPRLGPFPRRSDALSAEVAGWCRQCSPIPPLSRDQPSQRRIFVQPLHKEVSLESLIILGLLTSLAYWFFKHGKRLGSTGGFRAGCRWRRRRR